MKNQLFYLFTAFVFVAFSGCEKVQKVEDYPKHESKLVVNCLFKSDSTWQLDFSRSLSPLDNAPFKKIANDKAYAVIYKDGLTVDTVVYTPSLIGSFSKAYLAKYGTKPIPGSWYEIKTFVPGYAECSAREYLPLKPDVSNFNIITKSYNAISLDSYTSVFATKIMSFQLSDNPTENDFYEISLFNSDLGNPGSNFNLNYLNAEISANEVDNLNVFGISKTYITESFSSKRLETIKIEFSYFQYKITASPPLKITLEVKRFGENGFKYEKAKNKQLMNINDPFAEPTPIWNNIKNGFGVFGGYTSTFYEIEI